MQGGIWVVKYHLIFCIQEEYNECQVDDEEQKLCEEDDNLGGDVSWHADALHLLHVEVQDYTGPDGNELVEHEEDVSRGDEDRKVIMDEGQARHHPEHHEKK